MQTYDVVIVGAGGAGMAAALNASKDPSLNVAVITKVFPTRSHTGAAQGGMNAALGYRDETDTIESHFFDTVKGSDYLADQDAVEFFVNGMPDLDFSWNLWVFRILATSKVALLSAPSAVLRTRAAAIRPTKLVTWCCMRCMRTV